MTITRCDGCGIEQFYDDTYYQFDIRRHNENNTWTYNVDGVELCDQCYKKFQGWIKNVLEKTRKEIDDFLDK